MVAVLGLAACEATNQGYAPAQPVKYSHAYALIEPMPAAAQILDPPSRT